MCCGDRGGSGTRLSTGVYAVAMPTAPSLDRLSALAVRLAGVSASSAALLEERRTLARAARQEGCSVADIAEACAVSRQRAHRIAQGVDGQRVLSGDR